MLTHRNHTSGSSPRMRGKHQSARHRHHLHRIIPAHAGQTSTVRTMMTSIPDHPRACGANRNCLSFRLTRLGSSPRMRGKPSCRAVCRAPRRIIPAHAGQTGTRQATNGQDPNHPRACGANAPPRSTLNSSAGSSPRMRGKLGDSLHLPKGLRIIPAHAGQT